MKKAAKRWVMILSFLFIFIWAFMPPLTASAAGGNVNEVWDLSEDPWAILRGESSIDYEVSWLGGLWFQASLVRLLRHAITGLCILGVMISLIMIPFISNSADLKARKEDLTHKALIFAASFAVVPALNFLKYLFDLQFGFH